MVHETSPLTEILEDIHNSFTTEFIITSVKYDICFVTIIIDHKENVQVVKVSGKFMKN